MALDWDLITAHALTLPGTELVSFYGGMAPKVRGKAIVSPGRETGSFALHLPVEEIEMLMEADPGTFWQTPHYQGWPCVLVRYDSPDPDRILSLIEHAWELRASKAQRAARDVARG